MNERVDWHVPTCELRFVERTEKVNKPRYGELMFETRRVLQQLWRSPFPDNHPDEWRDVPLFSEDASE